MGLLYKILEPDLLLDEAVNLAAGYARNPRGAVLAAKRVYYRNQTEQDLSTILKMESEAIAASAQTPEHREAVAALREKRK